MGDSLIGHFPNTSEAELTTPEGAEHRLAVNNGQWTYDLTMSPGVYTIRPTAAGADTQLRGVNVDIAESDLSKIDASLLPPSLPLQPNKQTLESVSSGARLFRWLLIAVFCFVLMECWFSNRLLVRSRLPHSRI